LFLPVAIWTNNGEQYGDKDIDDGGDDGGGGQVVKSFSRQAE